MQQCRYSGEEVKDMLSIWLVLMIAFHARETPGSPRQINDDIQAVYDAVVKKDGTVDYEKLSRSPEYLAALNRFVAFAGRWNPDRVEEREEKIAILANSYNIFTLSGVIKAWPVASVRKIRPFFGFFTKKEWKLGGRKISLNQIEKNYLRSLDPRIHFIINCASVSCPVIPPKVLTGENVESLMNEATLQFLADSTKNQFDPVKKVWRLSKIFDWYADDWGGRDKVVAFIKKYRPDLASWEPEKIEYLEYDWALNGPIE